MVWAQAYRTRLPRAKTTVPLVRPLCGAVFTLASIMALSGADVSAQTAPPAAAEAKAKSKPKKKAPADEAKTSKKDPALAQQQIDQGIASLQAGKADLAVQQLTAALSGGSLPAPLMAKAFYNRGLAYRKQSKPDKAISDLTSALWLRGGLNDADRAEALQNRSAAYRDAGLPDQADTEGAGASALRSRAATTTPASGPPPAPKAPDGEPSVTRTASLPAQPAPANLAPQEAPAKSTGGGLGGFFGNIFGSGSTTAAPTAKPEPAVSAWASGTEVKPASGGAPARSKAPVASPAATTTVAVAPVPATQARPVAGRILLQVAQLKTREQAQAVAAQLKQQFAAELAGREATIVAVDVGGFGTLHRVRFGPFADASEWKGLCPRLLSEGHDCLGVDQ